MKNSILKMLASVIIVLAAATAGAGQAEEAIEAIRQGGTRDMSLNRARNVLIEEGARRVDRIVDVLIEGGVNVSAHARLNFAIVLSEIAREHDTSRLREGLLICTNDTNAGVRLIGLVGLNRLADFPEQDFAPVMTRLMEQGQPRHIRMKAIEIAVQRNMLTVAPDIFGALRRSVPAYERARNQAALEEVGGRIERETGVMYDDDTGRLLTGERRLLTGERRISDRDSRVDEITSERAREIIADNQGNIELLQKLADRLELKSEVSEVRRIGNALQRMTENLRDDEEEWGFLTRAPWELDQLAQTALGWFEQNRNLFQ